MSQLEDAKATAQEIAAGLRRMGPDRVVALSVHVNKELVEELEAKTKKLISDLDSLS